MKALVSFLVVVGLIGCGNDSSSGSSSDAGKCAESVVVGSWSATIAGNPDVMTFKADCSGSSSYCQSTFTYPPVSSSSGQVLVTNASTNAAYGCLPVGETKCLYEISGSIMSVSCGADVVAYTKQ